jgi:hypothetical protein
MKTFGSILLIVTAFAIVMGVTYLAVNAGNTSSSNVPALDGGGANFRPNGGGGVLNSAAKAAAPGFLEC